MSEDKKESINLNNLNEKFVERQSHLDRENNLQVANINGAVQLVSLALKYSIVVNGLAAISLLAFSGNVLTKSKVIKIPTTIVWPLGYYIAGILVAGIVFWIGYLTQRLYAEQTEMREKQADLLNKITFCFIISPYVFFGLGSCELIKENTKVIPKIK